MARYLWVLEGRLLGFRSKSSAREVECIMFHFVTLHTIRELKCHRGTAGSSCIISLQGDKANYDSLAFWELNY